jgi:archaellum component FlaG (FlaF/FlaG flagellin family)
MRMKRIFIAAMVLVTAIFIGGAALACEMNFTVISSDGETVEVQPGRELKLDKGEAYTMIIEFVEDHGRCETPADETVYLLEEERWKASKDYLPLSLSEQGAWEEVSPGTWEQELVFTAQESGKTELEVIRECPKGGYDETLEFKVK